MKYLARFTVYCGQTNNIRNPFEYTNKKRAIKDIREVAESQINGRQDSSWRVDDENGNLVASGGMFQGRRFRHK